MTTTERTPVPRPGVHDDGPAAPGALPPIAPVAASPAGPSSPIYTAACGQCGGRGGHEVWGAHEWDECGCVTETPCWLCGDPIDCRDSIPHEIADGNGYLRPVCKPCVALEPDEYDPERSAA